MRFSWIAQASPAGPAPTTRTSTGSSSRSTPCALRLTSPTPVLFTSRVLTAGSRARSLPMPRRGGRPPQPGFRPLRSLCPLRLFVLLGEEGTTVENAESAEEGGGSGPLADPVVSVRVDFFLPERDA